MSVKSEQEYMGMEGAFVEQLNLKDAPKGDINTKGHCRCTVAGFQLCTTT